MNNQKTTFTSDDRFALYSLPGSRDYWLMAQEDIGEASPNSPYSSDLPGFIFHPFQERQSTPRIFLRADTILKNPEISFIPKHTNKYYSTEKQNYLETVRRFIDATKSDVEKLVLSRLLVASHGSIRTFHIFRDLLRNYPEAFVYWFNDPVAGTWLGASPEIFFKADHDTGETVSLAGTRTIDVYGNLTSDWTIKEYEEQQLVTDFIKDTLTNHGITFSMSGPENHLAGKLMHLKTSFHFPIRDINLEKLIADLHPTPAVCGLPKEQAKAFITKYEPHDRAYYTGFLGPVFPEKQIDLYVNLRCLLLTKSQFVLYLGGGITAGSDPEFEWEETVNKAGTLLKVLKNIS